MTHMLADIGVADPSWVENVIKQGGPFAAALVLMLGGAYLGFKHILKPFLDSFTIITGNLRDTATQNALGQTQTKAALEQTAVIAATNKQTAETLERLVNKLIDQPAKVT